MFCDVREMIYKVTTIFLMVSKGSLKNVNIGAVASDNCRWLMFRKRRIFSEEGIE